MVIAILAHAAFLAGRDYIKNKTGAAVALRQALLFGFRINPVFVILAAGLTGLAGVCRRRAANLPRARGKHGQALANRAAACRSCRRLCAFIPA